MKVDDRGNDRQAQPETWVPVTFLAAIEPLEYRRTFLFGNPRAAVLNGNVQALVVLRRQHAHAATLWGELDSVAH